MNNITNLSLYHYQACPYCAATRQFIDNLGVDVERRDILLQPKHRTELIKEGGKPQMPCLRIDFDDGESEWLYESADIVEFVGEYAGEAAFNEMTYV